MSHRYGLLGKTLSHSFSPELHSKILHSINIDGTYELFEKNEDQLPCLLDELKALEIKGLNITIPYKTDMLRYVDSLSEQAQNIGSINTISFSDQGTKGYNTDYDGFKMMLDYFHVPISGKKYVILGAGGASRAILECLKNFQASEITLVSRFPEKAKEAFPSVHVASYDAVSDLKKDVIINCTPIGMYPETEASPLTCKDMNGISHLVDIIYNPRKTLLMKMAEDLHIPSINGLYMLVGQAIKSQEIWNNISIPKEITTKIYEEIRAK